MASIHAFCDYLKLSYPASETFFLRPRLEALAIEAGGHETRPGLFSLGDRGTVKFGELGKVGTVGVSGDALAALRAHKLFLPFLSTVSEYPHRVTQVDVAVDVPVDGPVLVARLYGQARRGEIQLTSRKLKQTKIRQVRRRAHVDGRETGTVYLGGRTSDVCARVYDKRNEILDRAIEEHGSHPSVIVANDPGPLTRYEITCGRHVGVTLRDVAEPTSLFWKFASSLLERPEGIPDWQPHAEGFEIVKHEPDVAQQLRLLLQNSPDIRRAAALSEQLGRGDRLLDRLESWWLHGLDPRRPLPVPWRKEGRPVAGLATPNLS